jgi:MFS transporter, OFA family, oxalate/formate antiporter
MKKNRISNFPFFYGYIIIFSGTIGVLMSAPGQTIGISVFTDFLIDALKIPRESLSLAYLIGTLSSSFLLTRAGKFFDRFGARLTSVLAALFLGFALFYLSEVVSITFFINNLFSEENHTMIVFISIVLGFFAVRFFGQGVLTMASRNMVMKWFDKRRGMASAIMGISLSFGFSYAPKIFDDLINIYGWQETWQILAGIIGGVFMIFAAISFRDNPFEYGLIADGTEITSIKKNEPIYHPATDYSLSEVRRTYSFWVFNISLSMQALYGTALTFHIIDIFNSVGLLREDAISVFLPMAIVAVVFEIISGYLADFMQMRYLLIVELCGMLISMSGLTLLGNEWAIYLIIAGNGIASGLFGVVSSVTWPRFFGLKHLGSISGFSMSWIVAGSALGPYLFSILYGLKGSYEIPALACLVLTLVLLILSFKAKNVNLKS